MSIAVDGNNRVVGHTYDGAGNTLSMPGFSGFTWDAHGRMKTVTANGQTDNYQYGSDDLRVYKNGKAYVRGAGGELLAEYDFNMGSLELSYQVGYGCFAGRVVGQKEDRLGTVRNGSRFYPYGEESASTPGDTNKFATYWRDAGTGLDYAMNRYYTSSLGRFLSPDPITTGAANNSQTWNRFAYTNGDPVNLNDPRGLYGCPANYQVSMIYGNITYRTTYIHLCYDAGYVVLMDNYYGWGSSLNSGGRSVYYVGANDIYESGSCTVVGTGVPCYQVDLARRYWGSLATEGCDAVTWLVGDCDDQMPASLAATGRFARNGWSAATAGLILALNRSQGLRFESTVASMFNLARNIGSGQFRLLNTLSGTVRIPDIVNRAQNMIGEIKSSYLYVPFTSQIRDMAAWAAQNNYTFNLYVAEEWEEFRICEARGLT